jgi:hypothetical protein
MTAQIAYIVKEYDELNLSIEDIVEEHSELEVESVKAVLATYSAKYRQAVKDEEGIPNGADKLGFSDEEAEAAKMAIAGLLQTTDDDYLRFRVAKRIIDEKKGRLDVDKDLKGLQLNVIEFNGMLRRLKEGMNRTKEMKVVKDAA